MLKKKELLIFITSPEKNELFSYKIEEFRIDGLFKFTEQYLVTAEYIFLLIEWGMNSYWERIPLITMFFLLNVVTSINHFISSHRYFTLYLPIPTTLFLPSAAIFPSMFHSRFLYCLPIPTFLPSSFTPLLSLLSYFPTVWCVCVYSYGAMAVVNTTVMITRLLFPVPQLLNILVLLH